MWITGLCVSVQLLVAAAFGATGPAVVLALAAYVAFGVQQLVFARRLTSAGPLVALAFPLTTVFFVAMFLRSAWCTFVRRRVSWRGRAIDLAAGVRPDRATRAR